MITILLKSSIELALVLLLIYGFIHEKQMIEFEQLLKRAVVIKFKLYKKNKALEQIRRNRDFRVVEGKMPAKKAKHGSLYVA